MARFCCGCSQLLPLHSQGRRCERCQATYDERYRDRSPQFGRGDVSAYIEPDGVMLVIRDRTGKSVETLIDVEDFAALQEWGNTHEDLMYQVYQRACKQEPQCPRCQWPAQIVERLQFGRPYNAQVVKMENPWGETEEPDMTLTHKWECWHSHFFYTDYQARFTVLQEDYEAYQRTLDEHAPF